MDECYKLRDLKGKQFILPISAELFLQGWRRGGNGELWFNGYRVAVCKMKSSGDCTTMYIYLTLLNISLKMIKMVSFCYAYLTTIGKKKIFLGLHSLIKINCVLYSSSGVLQVFSIWKLLRHPAQKNSALTQCFSNCPSPK